MVVPGSQTVKRAAEQEGLHRIFQEAGFEWRESGLLDVPGHESGHPCSRESVALPPAIGTLKDGRDAADGHIWSVR